MSSTIVSIKYDPTWEALDWAKENCPSYITNDASTEEHTSDDGLKYHEYKINYYFSTERDAAWFALKWG